MPSIIENIAGFFINRPAEENARQKLRTDLDSKIQEQKVYMNQRIMAMRQAAKKKEAFEAEALREKDAAKQALLIQKLKNAKGEALRYQKFASSCVRTIAALESEKAVLDLADEMTVAFGEEVSFDGILNDLAVVTKEYGKFNADLENLEMQASQLSEVGILNTAISEPSADDGEQEIFELLRKIQAEQDPVKRAELERQYHEKVEMPEIAAMGDA